jgi:AhpD family alkylhydroperoxidase
MSQRLAAGKVAPEMYKAALALENLLHDNVDHVIYELVKLRASMINGCAYCVDMHSTDAMHAGETTARLFGLAAWRETPLYTARERAALALTDAVTRLGDDGVPDELWDAARAEFDERELAHLVGLIAMINYWNRLGVTFQLTPRSASRA